ncbi:tRNA (guanosine(37)-N1)-methyltransferase TrmD [Candidatus Uhrbacteria bacterium CG_4_9_14_0_2_um_filter_41_50]|uniref:tRNA (guanine-N(1)-)-methyltransferase n=1 Tax=Candidatus Uhrbacteria bacterium CG_4_9_14_0_2_um_filter_41_50 TaxID=1975031 RepID=A0A2M8EQ46_9BACT|nr:MAG: tRNA (guanosine(37)-N1)-methyltransferase TrmD [Candidatus Uhrbacteria bacterium CG_4_10_14_3_um_filter_41_21]PIZ54689.1 MAG: tRNA (guanosine(37)-N1)-methyltransferase TrmD [Candidatus Uhrbacteria bacterium CG_4_10_14_0_2_um_filter_41_21]PJB84752.1 MAG: tRNA (guanosine(37)-N1)-methyltransferase TrmD [Candidatus Uhrbacteria bacterium CG_4_9_14_0_8_um_filter_41_16]PJC24854.1 MAG: tRNA (guanosine(37)-N1)-methyltransferase TrmD [Candidatus Uhrbacteria bacterium CG_4_9_14_0_2_um_filter_41_50]
MQFDIITLFPNIIDSYMQESIIGRAQKAKKIKIKVHDLRTFSKDKHRRVDDTPYGGGAGMVMTVQPIDDAVKKVTRVKGVKKIKTRIILTSASGKTFTQEDAKRLSKYDQLIFICGRYEGIDARVETEIADESLSIGNYVLTGGELPAMAMTDSVARLIPGVLGAKASLDEESHTTPGQLEYPQYTKPEVYGYKVVRGQGSGVRKKKILKVPAVLLSGNHAEIQKWRQEESKKRSR